MRRSLYFDQKLNKNTILQRKHIKIVRPFVSITPNSISRVIGKKLSKNVEDSESISFKIIK